MRLACAASMLVLACVSSGGCAASGAGVHLLNLIGLSEKPLIVCYVAEKTANTEGPLAILAPFAAAEPLHNAMGADLRRRTTPYLCMPFQLEFDLDLGVSHLAVISPVQYANFRDRAKFPVLAVSKDEAGRAARAALLVVLADSPIARIADLRDKTVAFGPRRDGRTHHAGLLLLAQNGVAQKDLALELFPVPGSLRTLAGSREIAESVHRGQSDAGFIDQLFWDSLPERAAAGELSREAFKVIEKTIAIPERLVVASPRLAQPEQDAVRRFLLTAHDKHPQALKSLHFAGYAEPSAELLAETVRLRDAKVAVEQP